MQQSAPRGPRPAAKQSVRYMVAEGATAEEAEVVLTENAQLRARIAELEGARKHRGMQIGVGRGPGAQIGKNGFGRKLNFSGSS